MKGIRISTESQEMGIYKSFNGKGKARIFIYPNSAMLRAKADSLQGYVTVNAPVEEALNKIYEIEQNIRTKL
jgi:hypothetical protein